MKKIAITSLICIISVLGIIQTGYAQEAKEIHTFNLQVFLEGPFNGTDMNTTIFDTGLLPSNQPYNIEPWNYFGSETLNVNPGDDVVDWVLIEFIKSPYGPASATPDKIIHREAALLMADGSIVQADGISLLEFEADIQENLYIVVRHRNHLAVLSANSVIPTKGTYYYNFTDDLTKAYLDGQKEIAPGVYGMIGSDCDANGIIENTDKDLCWTVKAGNMGYLPGDWNLNTQVNNPDKDDIWVVNLGMESMVPRAFECGDVLIDFRNDQTYNTVLIGDQCWMAENLNIGTRIDGINDQTDNSIIEKYCYDDNTSNCETYGGLYQWNEMMQYTNLPATQGICPAGWHIPTDNEWKYLEGSVDSQFGVGDPEWNNFGWRGNDAGGNLKEVGTLHWNSPNTGATNSSGFTALPGGYRHHTSYQFLNMGYLAFFMTSSDRNTYMEYRELNRGQQKIRRAHYFKELGYSVRCLKYTGVLNQSPVLPFNPSPAHEAVIPNNDTVLSWSCNDPDNDPLTFDVYFGTDADPPIVEPVTPDSTYDPGLLDCSTDYYWKIVAQDDHGNFTIGPVWSFTTTWECGCSFVDDRDDQTYNTVLIGDQCWMAENLNIGVYTESIILGWAHSDVSDNGIIEKYCYNNNINNCDIYGGFYDWNEMMNYTTDTAAQGICPDGWHIPTNFEWKVLEGTVDSQYGVGDPEWDNEGFRGFDAGLNLKSETGWSNNGNGTDAFGFTALPTGHRHDRGYFVGLDDLTTFWTSSPYPSWSWSWRRYLDYDHEDISNGAYFRERGISVRCLKTNQPPDAPSNPTPENGAINQPVNTVLNWTCSDPENDPLTFDVYFGTDPDPPLVEPVSPDSTYDPGLLYCSTIYYWRIVAQDDHGNYTEGPVWSFTTTWQCGCSFVDDRDGQSYNTVLIGDQCWMAENLNIGVYTESITLAWAHSDVSDNGIIEKYCYDNNINNCDIYGGFYDWNEMMCYVVDTATQGICPNGWHIPTNFEWKVLEGTVDSLYGVGDPEWDNEGFRGFDAGLNLKSETGWSNNGNGTDAFGFTALPTGLRHDRGYFVGLDDLTTFWTSSPYPSSSWSWRRYLDYDHDDISNGPYYRERGISVRCLKTNQPPDVPSNPLPEDGAINQTVNTTLSWTCTDPENDPLTYDVYFGTETDPPLLSEGISDLFCNPGILNYGITFYWKIVAEDDHGNMTTGSIWSFTTEVDPFICGDVLVDVRDGKSYNTVQIGTQCWMAENMNIGTRIDGTIDQSDNATIEKYCYDNLDGNCDIYGGLYQWDEMMQYSTTPCTQGICPEGWHLPTDAEWCTLENEVDAGTVPCGATGWRGVDAGGNLKESGTTHWSSPNTGATNSSGFTALPGGVRTIGGSFSDLSINAIFWSSNESGSNAWKRNLNYDLAQVYRNVNDKAYGFSVRCLRNNQPPDVPSNPLPEDGAINQTVNTTLSWTCTDPENDPLTYDVYFGTETDPPLFDEGISDLFCDPGILNYGITFYWKIAAEDDHGNMTTGSIWSFTTEVDPFICGDVLVDVRDGKSYNTVQIGTQCWMAENMNIGTRIDGTIDQSDNATIEKYCYDNLETNCDTYGGLYQWDEAMQYNGTPGTQGICPVGWHLPTDDEWKVLEGTVDSQYGVGHPIWDNLGWRGYDAGKNLKSTSGWTDGGNGTDIFGFTGLPAGIRDYTNGSFRNKNDYAYFWTSTDYFVTNTSIFRWLLYNYNNIIRHYGNNVEGMSVRCLKD